MDNNIIQRFFKSKNNFDLNKATQPKGCFVNSTCTTNFPMKMCHYDEFMCCFMNMMSHIKHIIEYELHKMTMNLHKGSLCVSLGLEGSTM